MSFSAFISFLAPEAINLLLKRGFDIIYIFSDEDPLTTISWKEGKKKNGFLIVIDENKINLTGIPNSGDIEDLFDN